MVKTGKLLVPWYRYPPFGEGRIGGLSVSVWELTTQLAGRGVHVDVLTPAPPAEKSNIPSGVKVIASTLGEKFFRNRPLEVDEEEHLGDYDAILSVANYGARTLSSFRDYPSRIARQIHAVAQDRGLASYLSLRPGIIEYLKMTYAKYGDERNLRRLTGTKTLCVSEYVNRRMKGGLENAENLFSIPNGIDTREFRPMREGKEFDLLFIGRFQKSKGLDVLLTALSSLATTKNEVYRLAVVGQFSSDQILYLLRGASSEVREAIVFLGTVQRSKLPLIINRAKALVAPSRYESFGLPALESIACGIPVLASRVGGLPEILDSSVGVLVEPNNYRAMAAAIHECMHDAELAQRALTSGPVKAAGYDWDTIAPKIQKVIFS